MSVQGIVVCVDEREYSLILESVSQEMRPFLTRSPAMRRFLAPRDAAAMIVQRAFVTPEDAEALQTRKRCGVRWPFIQILRNGEVRHRDAFEGAAAVLTRNEIRTGLVPALRRTIIAWRIARVAERSATRIAAATVVRAVFACVLTNDPPPRSVPDVAACVGRSKSHIFGKWRTSVASSVGVELRAFVDWVVLLRALESKSATRTWTGVAAHLGIRLERLEGHAAALADRSLKELEDDLGLAALGKLETDVLVKLGLHDEWE